MTLPTVFGECGCDLLARNLSFGLKLDILGNPRSPSTLGVIRPLTGQIQIVSYGNATTVARNR